MQSIEEILNAVRNLPARDRARLMHELRTLSPKSIDNPENASDNGPYSGLLALAGTAHTDFDDVSSDKYKHLGEIYADQHEHE